MHIDVDFVILYIDGNNKNHIKKLNKYKKENDVDQNPDTAKIS